MKTHRPFSLITAGLACLCYAMVFAEETPDMLGEALALVRKVENPASPPPTDAQKINLLKQAISEAQQAPNHRLQGHRVLAILAIRNAVTEIGKGDGDHKAAIFLQTADSEISTSIAFSGGTSPPPGAIVTPQSAGAYTALGDAKMRQSDWSGAIAAYDQAIEIDPKNLQAFVERGASKLMNKDRAGGLADYDAAIKLEPKNTEGYMRRAEAQSMADPKSALADYQQVIALDPQNKEAYKGVADLHWMHQDYEGTIAAYDQLIAVDPKNWYAYGCRALAKDAKGDSDGAIADYGQDILLEPTDFNAFHNRGQAKEKKGDLSGALADLNQAIALGMHDAYVYRERGDLRKETVDLDGALADYDQVVALDGKKDDAFVNLDEIYASRAAVKLAKRDFEGAIADYNQAIVLKDTNPMQDYFSIWVAQNLQGKKSDADKQLSTETADLQDNPPEWPAKVSAFLLGNMNEADFLAAAASSDAKTDAIQHGQVWYYAGIKQLLAGNKSAATEDFNKCVAANQKDECTFFAQAELKAMAKPSSPP